MRDSASHTSSNVFWKAGYLAPILFLLCGIGGQRQVSANQINGGPKTTSVSGSLRIGETIVIGVENLSSWSTQHDPQKLVLYLNGQPLKGLYPEIVDLSRNQLQFHLERTEGSSPVWSTLFRHPGLQRPVAVSVGLENDKPFDTNFDYDHPLSLTVISRRSGIIVLVITLAVFTLAIGLMVSTNIIRQSGPKLAQGKRRPYELGRFLTLFWSTIIVTSYFSVWLITGDSAFPATALALTGFSSLVALVRYMTSTGPDDASDSLVTAATSSESVNFLTDVLSGPNGQSFHRFQLLMWNLLLGFMFLFLAWEHLALPDFSQSLLALMGISTSIHLGFEFLDRHRVICGEVVEGNRF